jgi:chromate reductase
VADQVQILTFCGSLRTGSYNRMLLRAAEELAPEGVSFSTVDIGGLPLYNEDIRAQGFPPAVEEIRSQVRAAHALVFVTPEYNYSIPGVLKNAIDWASRPPDQPFNGKPAAIMGASPSMLGSARAQYHLRQVCVYLNILPINQPEVFVAAANRKFDADGRLSDEPARKLVVQLMQSLVTWTLRLRRGGTA